MPPLRSVPLARNLAGFVLLFLLVGQVMLFSATGVLGLQRYGSEFHYVLRQGITAILGVGLMLLLSQVRYQVWARIAGPLIFIQIALVSATFLPHLGHHAQGATRWLDLGGLHFQPSELAKLTVPILVARILASRHETLVPLKKWILEAVPILVLLLLIVRQPDLGSTALLVAIVIGLCFIAGARLLYIGGFLAGGIGLLILSMLTSEYRRRRLFAFLNPWADPQGSGFQLIQSFLSIHSGKTLGAGIGNGNSKLFFLPEVHTDFIFALVAEELGFVGAIVLLTLFLVFSYWLFKAALQSIDPFGRYLGLGLGIALTLQIAVNLGGVTGVIPIKGLPLPFISWGRSALLVNLAMMGILLNILKQSAIIQLTVQPHRM